MKDVMSVLGALTGRSSRYSAVSTQDVPMSNGDNVYNPTTTTTSAPHQQHPKSQSLDPSIAVFDRFLHGRLGEKKERKKCKSKVYTKKRYSFIISFRLYDQSVLQGLPSADVTNFFNSCPEISARQDYSTCI